jgi:hypothetical protein
MAQPHFVVKANEELEIMLAPYFAGFENCYFDIDGNVTTGFYYIKQIFSPDIKPIGFAITLSGKDNFLPELSVVAKNNETGHSMTRRFCFAVANATELGISDIVRPQSSSAPVYNLQGQRLSTPQRGLNIRQGHKFIKQ